MKLNAPFCITLPRVFFMELTTLEKLKLDIFKLLNTIESVDSIDYNNGVNVASEFIYNQASKLTIDGVLDTNSLTALNQLCSDKIMRYTPYQDKMEHGMIDGYQKMKDAILSGIQNK
jgi:hypothetical protein